MSIYQRTEKLLEHSVAFMAISVGIFHIVNVSGLLPFSDMTIRSIHLTAMMFIVFITKSKKKQSQDTILELSTKVVSVILSLFVGLYILYRWKDITSSGGLTNNMDIIVGVLAVILVLKSTRRAVGWMLSLITLLFLLYPFVGTYLPTIVNTRQYSFERVFSFLYSTQGIYGIPISVAATYIVLFCIYGAFLREFGAGEFLLNLSTSLTHKLNAAAAKTAIVFSSLTGMISGSAAGNVAITGTFTIPMMKKAGYKPRQAGAIEACASTGGQFMPPIMGAAAFMMAEITATPYTSIMKAVLLPSFLFYLSLFFIVDLQARKSGINKSSEDENYKSFREVLRDGWYFLVPILTLIFMLVIGYSPFKAAYYSIIAMVFTYIIAKRQFNLEIFSKIIQSIKKGAMDTASIAMACASAGIIVGILSITGLGAKLSSLIVIFSNGQLILALLITMVVAIILGMGLPTTAAYLVLASVVAPALTNMGIPLLTAHLFVFFFGCISTITPPVALASYVAAGIAGTDLNKVGWTAFQIGLVSFILPFMFVYSPTMLLEGSIISISITIVMSILGIYVFATSIVGFYRTKLSIYQRVCLFVAALLLINGDVLTSIVGILIVTIIFLSIKFIKKDRKEMSFIRSERDEYHSS